MIPITDEMKTGKAPMRTFSDLMQFFEIKQQGPETKLPDNQPVKPPDAQPPKENPQPDADGNQEPQDGGG